MILNIKGFRTIVFIFILFTQPLRLGRVWHKVNFLAEFNRFKFRVFLLLD